MTVQKRVEEEEKKEQKSKLNLWQTLIFKILTYLHMISNYIATGHIHQKNCRKSLYKRQYMITL